MSAVFLLLFALALFSSTPAQSQPAYSYGTFHTELFINADGSLLIRNEVAYDFSDPSTTVGLYIPASYGTLVEARILGGDGNVLPEDSWGYEQGADGYTLWCENIGEGEQATYTYEYLLHGAFVISGDRAGIEYWSAVPEERDSPINETSLTLHFPPGADPDLIELSVAPLDYSGQITQHFVGDSTAIIEASFLDVSSSYSIRCYWPTDLMDQSGAGFSASQEKSWDFERFDTEITVNADSSYTVRETQVANFRGSFSWLNRDLSTEPAYGFDGRTYGRVRIHDIAVYGLDGLPYDDGMWSIDSYEGGKRVRIDFAAQDEQMGWIIEYRMTGALIFADDYDRLLWDAVSVDRAVPVKSSTITLHLPPGTSMDGVDTTQYIDISQPPSAYDSGSEAEYLWWRVQDIPAFTTFTIDVTFPKGMVVKPWQYDRACGIMVIALSSLLISASLLIMVILWWRKGRDVGRTGTAIVRYEPPEGLTPAMIGMLVNQKPRVQDISATIVDLARRGYLTIIEDERRSLIRIKQFSFQRNRDDLSGLLPYEREIMEGLFSSGERVGESDLKNRFYTRIDTILNHGIKKEVMDRGLFTREPGVLRSRYLTAGIIIAALPLAAVFILPVWLDLGWFMVLLLSFIPTGAVVAIVGWAMPSRSADGSRAYEHVLGFREYMETAEKPELEYMTPDNFQANLPYAMVLEVADEWAGKFQDIYTTPPQWYSGTGTTFSALYLTSSLNDLTGHLNTTLTSSPRSSGSGGGFGGGSSGGGFGGGGSSAG